MQGGYASTALLDAATVQTLPSWLSFVEATAMYFPSLLAWLALRERGHYAPARPSSSTPRRAVWAREWSSSPRPSAPWSSRPREAMRRSTSAGDSGQTMPSITVRRIFVGHVDDVTNGRGVDLAFDSVGGQVTKDTFRRMAFNGRHLIVRFAADITLEEEPVSRQPGIYGNVDLVGICFAFVDDPRLTHSPGMNFLSRADAIRMWAEILWMTMAKPIRPVVGREIDFGDIPPSLEMIERRETVGKTIIAAPQ